MSSIGAGGGHGMPADPPDLPANPSERPGLLLSLVRDQRVAFVAVGAVNTAIGFLAFVLFDLVYATAVPAWAGLVHNTATLLSAHVVSVLIAFVLHRTLVFRVRGDVWRDLARFESVYLVGLGLNWLLLNLLSLVGGLSPVLAQACVVGVIAFASFFGHKHFSFRRPGPGAEQPDGRAS